mmetsp:Transcript_38797/g.101437  ORF Transcript_38797/g.101437 Transcript_38797/m.101437 type:complete len:204 (-) Transcript_38797:449-1060(-)
MPTNAAARRITTLRSATRPRAGWMPHGRFVLVPQRLHDWPTLGPRRPHAALSHGPGGDSCSPPPRPLPLCTSPPSVLAASPSSDRAARRTNVRRCPACLPALTCSFKADAASGQPHGPGIPAGFRHDGLKGVWSDARDALVEYASGLRGREQPRCVWCCAPLHSVAMTAWPSWLGPHSARPPWSQPFASNAGRVEPSANTGSC